MFYRMCSFRFRLERNTIPGLMLCFCWVAGSSLGLVAARFCGDAFASWFTLLPGQIPGWGSILVLSVLPLLLSASAVILLHPAVCFLCCFSRGIGQGIMIAILGRLFGSGTPFMVFLLLFSSLCANPVLLWYWYRCVTQEGIIIADTAVCTVLSLLIGVLDRCAIAPFLADVFYF